MIFTVACGSFLSLRHVGSLDVYVGSSRLIRDQTKPTLGAQGLSHWTTRGVPYVFLTIEITYEYKLVQKMAIKNLPLLGL